MDRWMGARVDQWNGEEKKMKRDSRTEGQTDHGSTDSRRCERGQRFDKNSLGNLWCVK